VGKKSKKSQKKNDTITTNDEDDNANDENESNKACDDDEEEEGGISAGIGSRLIRVQVGGWIQMQITELHAILYRRLQREIESLLRLKVETPEHDVRQRVHNLGRIIQSLLLR